MVKGFPNSICTVDQISSNEEGVEPYLVFAERNILVTFLRRRVICFAYGWHFLKLGYIVYIIYVYIFICLLKQSVMMFFSGKARCVMTPNEYSFFHLLIRLRFYSKRIKKKCLHLLKKVKVFKKKFHKEISEYDFVNSIICLCEIVYV